MTRMKANVPAETEFHRLVNYQGWDEDAAKKRAIEYEDVYAYLMDLLLK